jgi:RNA recognition motif-containing protein
LKLFIGNLDLETTSQQLHELFLRFGTVDYALAAMNHQTRKGDGYGYVDMPDELEAEAALRGLEGFRLRGRPLMIRQQS